MTVAAVSIRGIQSMRDSLSIRIQRFIGRVLRSAAFRICVACSMIVAISSLGLYHELRMIESNVIKSQMSEVRSNAERTAMYIEQDMYRSRGRDLSVVVRDSNWLFALWERTKNQEPIREFRAIVDNRNRIVAHTDSEKVGRIALSNLEVPDAKNRRVGFRTDPALADDKPFVEIRVPIRKFRGTVGFYVSGIASNWMAEKVAKEQHGTWVTWISVICCAVVIVAFTGIVVYRLAKRADALERELDSAETRRLSELSMLLVGMAHEIRNPLNSIRLNLHTSERVFSGEAQLEPHEVQSMVSESVREVERVNEIISQLLGLARQEVPSHEYANAKQEIESAIQFFRTTFELLKIGVHFHDHGNEVWVAIDRSRFRQILVNIMNNALEALPKGGEIEIHLEADRVSASLSISDSGNGVDETLRSEIFEPFVTTRQNGTGLGLSVVRSIVEQVGGAVTCRKSEKLGGAEFLLRVPRIPIDTPTAA
jgi:nitrogen-specific signal transduction histidine kinase